MERTVRLLQSWVQHQERLVLELQDQRQEDSLAAAEAAAVKYLLVPLQEDLEVVELLENQQVLQLLQIQEAAEAAVTLEEVVTVAAVTADLE
jgi:hypothetical protein